MTKCGSSVGHRVRRHGTGRPAPGRDHQARLGEALPQPAGRGVGRALPRRIPHVEWRGVPDRAKHLGSTPRELPRRSGTVATTDDRPGRRGHAGRVRLCTVAAGISDDFVREVADLIKPGTSVLFVLDDGGDIDAILPAIRGFGGTVLKTNVDLERAKLIQSTLAASDRRSARSRLSEANDDRPESSRPKT